jgi:hypothetical protein
MASSVLSLRGRLEKLIRSWHPCLTTDFREVLESRSVTSSRGAADPASEHKQPYWLLLPRWLASVYRNDAGSKASHRRFVEDILWGQYCLFLCVKIHDDLYDQHTKRLSLVYAGDEFLLEAHRIFSLHFGTSSSFWNFFYSSLRESLQAIVALNNLQFGGNARRADVLKYYGKEYSLCKIGTYAICLQAKRRKDFSRVAAFSDQMAIVGQVLDDLQDMKKDIEDGRLNYAASFLFHYGTNRKRRSRQPVRRISRNLLVTDASTKLFRELRGRVGLAEDLIRPLKLPDASRYLESYRRSLNNMEAHLHRGRVKHIFGTRATHLV